MSQSILPTDPNDQSGPDPGPYFPLLPLVAAWASDAQEPAIMVLRKLCDWTMVGAVPPNALVMETGESLQPFDVFMSARAVSNPFGMIELAGYQLHNSGWGTELLARVVVSERGVRALCERLDILPPSPLRGIVMGACGTAHEKRVSLPSCPTAEVEATRYHTCNSAKGAIVSLRLLLSSLQGRLGPVPPGRPDDRPFNLDYAAKEWRRQKESAQLDIDACNDAQLQTELDALSSEWEDLVSATQRRQTCSPARTTDEVASTPFSDTANAPSASQSAGRYSAAEAELFYKKWIARNLEAGVIPSREEDEKAVEVELGEGVPRDVVRDLRRKLAPEGWRKSGRRKVADGGARRQ